MLCTARKKFRPNQNRNMSKKSLRIRIERGLLAMLGVMFVLITALGITISDLSNVALVAFLVLFGLLGIALLSRAVFWPRPRDKADPFG
jgi:hypothetical protein